jgi:hypothetical protein
VFCSLGERSGVPIARSKPVNRRFAISKHALLALPRDHFLSRAFQACNDQPSGIGLHASRQAEDRQVEPQSMETVVVHIKSMGRSPEHCLRVFVRAIVAGLANSVRGDQMRR